MSAATCWPGALSYRLFVFSLPAAFFAVSGLGLLASVLGIQAHLISNSVGLSGIVTNQVASTAKAASNWWVALSSFFVLVYATRVLFRAIAIVHSLAWERSAASVKLRPRPFGICAAALAGQLLLVVGLSAVKHQTRSAAFSRSSSSCSRWPARGWSSRWKRPIRPPDGRT